MKNLAINTIVIFGLLFSLPVLAMDLKQAKALGLVGEQANGYLGLVQDSAEAEGLVKEINSKRKVKYQQIAQKNATKLSVVQELAGKKAMEKTPEGQFVRKASGSWVKK